MTTLESGVSDTPRTDAFARTVPWNTGTIAVLRHAEQLEREVGARQAEIDRLMLEYCPAEMTPEQIDNWKKHQTGDALCSTTK